MRAPARISRVKFWRRSSSMRRTRANIFLPIQFLRPAHSLLYGDSLQAFVAVLSPKCRWRASPRTNRICGRNSPTFLGGKVGYKDFEQDHATESADVSRARHADVLTLRRQEPMGRGQGKCQNPFAAFAAGAAPALAAQWRSRNRRPAPPRAKMKIRDPQGPDRRDAPAKSPGSGAAKVTAGLARDHSAASRSGRKRSRHHPAFSRSNSAPAGGAHALHADLRRCDWRWIRTAPAPDRGMKQAGGTPSESEAEKAPRAARPDVRDRFSIDAFLGWARNHRSQHCKLHRSIVILFAFLWQFSSPN